MASVNKATLVAIRGGGGIRVVFGDRTAECHVGMDEATYARASADVDALLRDMAAHLAAEEAQKPRETDNG